MTNKPIHLSAAAALALKITAVWLLAAGILAGPAVGQIAPDANLAGQFSGYLYEADCTQRTAIGLEVSAVGNDTYEATLYLGGLPAERSTPVSDDDTAELEGTLEDHTLKLTGDTPLTFQFIHGRYTALDEENNYLGHLERVLRLHSNP